MHNEGVQPNPSAACFRTPLVSAEPILLHHQAVSSQHPPATSSTLATPLCVICSSTSRRDLGRMCPN